MKGLTMANPATCARVAWVDVAKGICIVLVVLMHATFGVEKALGEPTPLHAFIEWARPFRMPDFFLISGLFLAARIDRPWSRYLDTKVLYFGYFYVLWLTIQFAVKSPAMIADNGLGATLSSYSTAFVQPWGTLWFIYLLAIFFVAAKLLEPLPKIAVIAIAAFLYLVVPHTGMLIIDEFANRFIFFYTGYAAAPAVFAFAAWLGTQNRGAIAALVALWAYLNGLAVAGGWAFWPGLDLAVSYLGIAAVIAFSVLILATVPGRTLAYCGRHSIAIYLAFPLFMAPARVLALKLVSIAPGWAAALFSAAAGICGALLLALIVRGTRLAFLFERPAQFHLDSIRSRLLRSPAHTPQTGLQARIAHVVNHTDVRRTNDAHADRTV